MLATFFIVFVPQVKLNCIPFFFRKLCSELCENCSKLTKVHNSIKGIQIETQTEELPSP